LSSTEIQTFEVLLDADDYAAAQALHTRWTARRTLFSLAAIVGGIVLVLLSHHWTIVAGCALIGGAVSGAITFETLRRFLIPRRARRLFAQQKNLRRPTVFHWDDHGLSWTSVQSSGTTPWTDYLKWRENEHMFLLYHSDLMFQMLPKRAFRDAELLKSFATVVHRIPAA
jgi:hypothetical protein